MSNRFYWTIFWLGIGLLLISVWVKLDTGVSLASTIWRLFQ